jgi:hypothetical protein
MTTIRIDALPATATPTAAHVLPAMAGGVTARLTVAQILSLIDPEDIAFASGAGLTSEDVAAALDELAVRDASTVPFASAAGLIAEQVAAALDELAARSVPSGTVIWCATSASPPGYLKANGAAVSRTTYAGLFAAIGTDYGSGDGSTTFNVPDLRGEFVRGWDDGRGVDSGRALGSAQAQGTAKNGLSATTSATSNAVSMQPNTGGGLDLSRGPVAGTVTLTSTDSETRPRNVALLACIKV